MSNLGSDASKSAASPTSENTQRWDFYQRRCFENLPNADVFLELQAATLPSIPADLAPAELNEPAPVNMAKLLSSRVFDVALFESAPLVQPATEFIALVQEQRGLAFALRVAFVMPNLDREVVRNLIDKMSGESCFEKINSELAEDLQNRLTMNPQVSVADAITAIRSSYGSIWDLVEYFQPRQSKYNRVANSDFTTSEHMVIGLGRLGFYDERVLRYLRDVKIMPFELTERQDTVVSAYIDELELRDSEKSSLANSALAAAGVSY